MSFDPDAQDPAVRRASTEVALLLRDRQLERYRRWLATRSTWPEGWRTAAIDHEYGFWLTREELAQLQEELAERLLALHRERLEDPAARPEGAIPIEMLVFAFPMGEP